MSEQNDNNSNNTPKPSRLSKIILIICLIIITVCIAGFGWAYYKFTHTDDLAVFASQRLSKPGKTLVTIKRFKDTLPVITAEEVTFQKISESSPLTVKAKEVLISPDYGNIKNGSHCFDLNDASLYLKRKNFLLDSSPITIKGKYNSVSKNITIASSTFNVFNGIIHILGDISTKKSPNSYDLSAKLINIKLEKILEGTKNKGFYTGTVNGNLKVKSEGNQRKPPISGSVSIAITNGTYNKPDLFERVCDAFHELGLRSKLEKFAGEIASGTFQLTGDFKVENKTYKTDNCELLLSFAKIKFNGTIGPESALNGTFSVKIKDYSTFELKVSGTDKRNLHYDISDNDSGHVASIIAREALKGTESDIKAEGRRFNRHIKDDLRKAGHKIKNWFK